SKRESRSSARCARTSSSASASTRSEEHTSELQSRLQLVCRLLLEKKKVAGAVTLRARRADGEAARGIERPELDRREVGYFFFFSAGHHQDLHSFPTRRSSD